MPRPIASHSGRQHVLEEACLGTAALAIIGKLACLLLACLLACAINGLLPHIAVVQIETLQQAVPYNYVHK